MIKKKTETLTYFLWEQQEIVWKLIYKQKIKLKTDNNLCIISPGGYYVKFLED